MTAPTTPAAAPPAKKALLFAVLVAVGLAWGSTMPLSKISVSTGLHPVGLIFWQLVISVAILGPWVALRRRLPRVDRRTGGFFLGVALLGTLIPNIASLTAAVHLPSGVIAIVISMSPIAAALLAAGLGAERLTPVRAAGVALGAVAILLILGPDAVGSGGGLPDPGVWPFVIVALISALCYGGEGVYVDLRQPRGMDPPAALLGASLLGLAIIAPLAAFVPGWWTPLPGPWGAPEQAVVASALLHAFCYTGYVWLVGAGGPVFASFVSYIVTVAGVGWGVAVLGESHSGWVWTAMALMIAGMALVQPRAAET